MIVLAVAVIGTVFLLPRFAPEIHIEEESTGNTVVPDASPAQVTPSTAAELTHYRQESQTVLAEAVVLRERLRAAGVEIWAAPDFQQALDRIAEGDERYSYGDYDVSLELYKNSRDQLVALEALGQQKLADAMAEAEEAVRTLNTVLATTAIELAAAIAPDDPQVQKLAARVANLDQLARHIEAGDEALAHDRFKDAQAEYQAAVALDPEHERASQSLADARREVTASTYRGHMSRGFAALENQDYDAARAAFRAAGKIYPGDAAVAQALAQLDNLEAGSLVAGEIQRAAELEDREAWAEAVAIYEAMLEQDPSLSDARVRLITTRVRADLDARMQAYVDDPLKVSSKKAYEEGQATLRDARGIPDPGPRLSGQIEALDRILKLANSPVEVTFRSDNQTFVVLYRVAELGRFEQKSVKLRPGKYIVAGTRNGYRDVRVEFTITGEPLDEPITVRCEESV